MLEAIKRVIRIIREEAKRRGWFSVLKAILLLLGYIGLSVIALHPLLKWLFPSSIVAAWVVMGALAVTVSLLVVINFMRTYHERIIKEVLKVWPDRLEIIHFLHEAMDWGRNLSDKCKGSDTVPSEDISRWRRDTASKVERMLGIEHRRMFYEHSETGENHPSVPHECQLWIDTRLVKLRQFMAEAEQPPEQLVSYTAKNQISRILRT